MTSISRRWSLPILAVAIVVVTFETVHAQLPMCTVHETEEDGTKRVGPAQEHAPVMAAIMAAMDARVRAECVPPPADVRVQPADVYCKFRTNVAEATWNGEVRWNRGDWNPPYWQTIGGRKTIERPGQQPETVDIEPEPASAANDNYRSSCWMGCRGTTNATLGTAEWEDIDFQNRPEWFIPPANDPDAEQEYCWAAQTELINRGADCQLTEAASRWHVYERSPNPWRETDTMDIVPFDRTVCGIREHGYYAYRQWVLAPENERQQMCEHLFNQRYPTDTDKNEACRAAGNSYGIAVKWNVGGAVCGEPIRPPQICDDVTR
jgi:hypothetical protein